MQILFISRSFPPQKGGLEKVSFQLYTSLSQKAKVRLIKWGGSKKWLFLVLPSFVFRSIWVILSSKIDLVYLSDGVLSLLIPFLLIFKKPVVITIHGLDISYKNKIYQAVIPKCVSLASKVITVSKNTKKECLKRGIPENKIQTVPNGFYDSFFIPSKDKQSLKKSLSRRINIDLFEKKVILSAGRLIERKGINWFLNNSLPGIINKRKDTIYLIAGEGTMRKTIAETVKKLRLEKHTALLGKVSEDDLRILYNLADLFVMPNIPVVGDLEGFGIVALEAASCELPVVASDLEGIPEALAGGEAGILVPARDGKKFERAILAFLNNGLSCREYGKKARRAVLSDFLWDKVIRGYLSVFRDTLNKANPNG